MDKYIKKKIHKIYKVTAFLAIFMRLRQVQADSGTNRPRSAQPTHAGTYRLRSKYLISLILTLIKILGYYEEKKT